MKKIIQSTDDKLVKPTVKKRSPKILSKSLEYFNSRYKVVTNEVLFNPQWLDSRGWFTHICLDTALNYYLSACRVAKCNAPQIGARMIFVNTQVGPLIVFHVDNAQHQDLSVQLPTQLSSLKIPFNENLTVLDLGLLLNTNSELLLRKLHAGQ